MKSARRPDDVASARPEPIDLEPGTIGVMADIHANPFALAAVIGDGMAQGVSRWLILGDVVAMGPAPGRVLEQLAGLDIVASIRGNTERYVLTGDRPDPSLEAVAADPQLLPRLVEVAASCAWTKGYLQALGLLDRLRSFVPSARFRFPDATSALAVHASLVADDGRGISPEIDGDDLAFRFPALDASVVFGGHTHAATDRHHAGTRFINPGSVSNHDQPHLGAHYSILRLEPDTHTIEHHEVGYDKRRAVEAIETCGIPGAGFLLARYFATERGA